MLTPPWRAGGAPRGRRAPDGIVERAATFAGYRTRVLEVAGQGPPFLLLHGFSDSADTWWPLLQHLARRGRRARAVDLPSHGCADGLDPYLPALPQLVAFAEAAVLALAGGPEAAPTPAGRPIVVGNSLGGMTALLLAERCETLGGIVPIAPAGFDYILPMRAALAQPVLGERVAHVLGADSRVPMAVVTRFYAGAIRWAHARPTRADRAYVAAYRSHLADRQAQHRLALLLRCLVEETRGVAPFQCGLVRCPVMLVWGDHDRITPPRAVRRVQAVLPQARTEVLAGTGHVPQREAPDRIADLLCEFAASTAG